VALSEADLTKKDSNDHLSGAELASRVFTIVMLGVCAVILLLAIMGDG
jgi:hypothetical protein